MHEASIVANIFRIVREKMDELYSQQFPVRKIKVVVGQMSTVVPEALDFAFDLVGQGTVFEGVQREIEYVPLKIRCEDCNKEMVIEEPFLFCRECDSFNISVVTGKELYVDSFEIDDDAEPILTTEDEIINGDKSRGKSTVKK